MKGVLLAFGRAVASQIKLRMLLLTFLPFFLATLLWTGLLWLGFQPFIDAIGVYFNEHGYFAESNKWLTFFGLATLKIIIVPLIAMWLLLPLMVVTAHLFVNVLAIPAVVRHVGSRYYPQLERRQGGSFWRLLWITISSVFIFILLWIVTIPLCALPFVGFLIQPLLLGWLTCRLIANEVLATYVGNEERQALMRKHRWSFLLIGTVTGALAVAPTLLWLGGVMMVVLFPFVAMLSIWLYVLTFVFSSLWFAHFGLAVVQHSRQSINSGGAETLEPV